MALLINTHYRQVLTSEGINEKVNDIVGGNALISGFEVSKYNNTQIKIMPGKCVIRGAFIEETDTERTLSVTSPSKIVLQYSHEEEALNYVIKNTEILDNELVIAEVNFNGSAISEIILSKQVSMLKDAGNKYPNYISEFTDSKYEEFTGKGSIEINDSIRSSCDVGVEGETVQNMKGIEVYHSVQHGTVSRSNGIATVTSVEEGMNGCRVLSVIKSDLIKKSTTYTIILRELLMPSYSCRIRDLPNAIEIKSFVITKENPMAVFTTPDKLSNQYILYFQGLCTNDKVRVEDNIILLEGDWTNREIPDYFTGIQGVGKINDNGEYDVIINSNGKNLVDPDNIKRVGYSYGTNLCYNFKNTPPAYSSNCIGNYLPAPVKPNTEYHFNYDNKVSSNYYHIFCYDKYGNYLNKINFVNWSRDSVIKTREGVHFITVFPVSGSIKSVDFELTKNSLSLIESSERVAIEPYQGDTLTYTLDEPLHRLPNGTCDEITADGVLIRRVGKVVLDGSEDWQIGYVGTAPDIIRGFIYIEDCLKQKGDISCMSDNFIFSSGDSNFKYFRVSYDYYLTSPVVWLYIPRLDLPSNDPDGFKQWIQENPTTVYYELETPTYTKLPGIQKLDIFDEKTYISVDSIIKPNIKIKAPANVGAVIRDNHDRISEIEDLLDKMILPGIVDTDYRRITLEFNFDYQR